MGSRSSEIGPPPTRPELQAAMVDPANYGSAYFAHRQKNDPVRLAAFAIERRLLEERLDPSVFLKGRVLDVGCSTGEFLETIGWDLSQAFGMEVSDFARQRAQSAGISFAKTIFDEENFFDLVVFRGTIQYLPNPFEYLYAAYRALKPGGTLFLLAPNTNSPYYRAFGTLPYLEEHLHFWIPSDASLRMVLRNCGFRRIDVTFPYLGSPYARPVRDHLKFLVKRLFRTGHKFAFWRNSMYVFAEKPADQ
ncbi:MAG TPA: class I SAM-dependent methyltransferase [Thermoanaerobaculia bacterium]